MSTKTFRTLVSVGLLCIAGLTGPSQAQVITQPISNSAITRLPGNTRPEAIPANDLGRAADAMPMENIQILLRRPADRQQALDAFMEEQNDPNSPNYQHWLTADELAAQYGPAPSDVDKVTGWLRSQGFTVNHVTLSNTIIDFTGTAGQVAQAFHTEIHNINVSGAARYANFSDPAIPTALAPAVVGVVQLHNIPPKPQIVPKSQYSAGSGAYLVVPSDLWKIYNFSPTFSAGITGAGQTIYLVEDTNVYSSTELSTFRSTLGVNTIAPQGSFTNAIHPAPGNGGSACTNPGTNGNDGEATLDAQWASAAAPGAAIVMATCADTTSAGPLIAAQNLIANPGTYPPAILSMSYGDCEANDGATLNAAFNMAFQNGAAEGWSIFVSSGDQLATVCDRDAAAATHGVAVNGWGSTPYNVSVGGTDFSDTATGITATYWASSNNANYGSALSYLPEIPWNDSCASQILSFYYGYQYTYSSSGFCNLVTGLGYSGLLNTIGGSGGPSACATGTATIAGVVSGTCAGYAKPSWQTGVYGIPADSVRDLPDVSLFAANGVWGHYYVYCYNDAANGGTANCSGAPSTWSGAGGTSFSSPIMAGVQALLNQKANVPHSGNPNPRLYALAAQQYSSVGSACDSRRGALVAGQCIFYNVTQGDIDAPCTGAVNCYLPSGTYGVESTSNSSYQNAYQATPGWSFATGLGTINVANLVNNWVTAPNHWTIASAGHFNTNAGTIPSDILWRDYAGDVAVWRMNGLTVSSSATLGAATSTWQIAGTGDFNGDGKSDILWRDNAGNVAVWLVNGGTVTGAFLGAAPLTWQIVGTGDFNKDGTSDVLLRNNQTGDIAIWYVSAAAVTSGKVIGNLTNNWVVAGTGDFNGDGYSDILLRNTATGDVGIWFMGGTSTSPTVTGAGVATVSMDWQIAGVGSFDGTARSDILLRQASTGVVGVWMMNGATITASGSLGAVSNIWTISGVGDFDSNGKADIVWRDSVGDVAIWFVNVTGGVVNAASVASSGIVAAVQ